MHFIFCLIFTFIIIFTTNSYSEADPTSLAEPKLTKGAERNIALTFETEFVFSAGYRKDELDWNIAGNINGNNPNILSELTWEDLLRNSI